jgi:hypoxanthine phosphoribosyltransferase
MVYDMKMYQKDIEKMAEHLSECKHQIHLVSIYRGSLGIGAHLSNILNAPLSIVKFQRYDSNDKEVKLIHNADINSSDKIVIIDDLLDRGNTLKMVYDFFHKEFSHNPIVSLTIFSSTERNNIVPNNTYLREKPQEYIDFWWELSKNTL